ncbi:uncharacterized protein HD556DRAFT_1479397 [Suillus plorans]|uniref:P5A-ATPase transmembrane helical hairpin domain-containing protein n=1 Tax=Suillus plorans TaxID=116603 RepID=A0A9P7ANZ0_9AGAM|nr:uncharacterized protein HD556DRAFT_1479397 [Suillus plorans]KAG1793294.1 hypothetical protein HD556DRAFT_1479397 [Suillus plorans]
MLNCRASVAVQSNEIAKASLHVALPCYTHLYTIPFLSLYPLLAYAYYIKYDDWLKSEEWTFLACVSLGAGHALSFLVTRWRCRLIRLVPYVHRGQGEIVPLLKDVPSEPMSYAFNYQRDTYVVAGKNPVVFPRLPYPCTQRPPLSTFLQSTGLNLDAILPLKSLYGKK